MTALTRRRVRNYFMAGMGATVLAVVIYLYDLSLRDTAFLDGWLLTAGMVFLALYNARKKVNVLPLLSAPTWFQAHVYVGTVCGFLFLVHTDFGLPNGMFETLLWVLFVLLVASGVIGLILTRQLPARLAAHGERIIFERIPGFRADLAKEARDLALRAARESGSKAIADFYAEKLHGYLRKPRHFWSHLLGRDVRLRRMIDQVRDLHRYQEAGGRAILDEIEALIVAKDNLDFQYALQLALKIWLFAHIPLTYSVFLVTIVHILLAYAFTWGGQ